MLLCCENCFDDGYLKEYIREVGSTGVCQYCGSTGAYCINVAQLSGLFEPVIDLYEPLERGVHYTDGDDPHRIGDSLTQLLNEDWEIFSDQLTGTGNESGLIDDIVNAYREPKESIDTGGLWISKDRAFTYTSPEEKRDEFAHHIKSERRFILGHAEHKDPHDWLQHRLLLSEFNRLAGFSIFRARIGHKLTEQGEKLPLGLAEMGPPSPEDSPGGRANPPGIPFLYTALDQPTAVAEIRPWKGALVSVAKFVLTRKITIIDLANIPPIQTPFGIDSLAWVLESRYMLSILGDKLSMPIDPYASEIEYVPTQYLAELIRDLRYDGILYKSGLGPNDNLVLFDPSAARVESVDLVEVTDVRYNFRNL